MEVTIENYEEKRKELIEQNTNFNAVILNEKEKKADSVLQKIKKEYFDECGGNVKFDMPVLTDTRIRESKLYKFCSLLPKGADLHVHDMSLIPACELITLLEDCPEFCINSDRKSFDLALFDPKGTLPEGYIGFGDAVRKGFYTREEIIENWTFAGYNESESGVWPFFEKLFDKHAVLSGNPEFAEKYYNYAFRYYCRLKIMHVEIHIMLTESIDESAEYIKMMYRAYTNVKKEYPYFTLRIIGAGVKADNSNIELTKKCFLNTAYVQEMFKDETCTDSPQNLVIGFDLVNEEDTSLPLHDFAPMLLKVKKQFPDMNLYIHGGESINAENNNLIDAYLLGASRVGHGLNLYRYPDLHKRFIQSEICLELCPVSNQKLLYTKDIRNHPATEYMRSGVAMAICSDDPAYMENETLTDDYFAATVGWNLGIADIKQFGINSIMFSGLDKVSKRQSLSQYNRMWNDFIDEIKNTD